MSDEGSSDTGSEVDTFEDFNKGVVESLFDPTPGFDASRGVSTTPALGMADILTAPIETAIKVGTFGVVDPEFTGRDIMPEMFGRAPQIAGVEINPLNALNALAPGVGSALTHMANRNATVSLTGGPPQPHAPLGDDGTTNEPMPKPAPRSILAAPVESILAPVPVPTPAPTTPYAPQMGYWQGNEFIFPRKKSILGVS